MSCTPCDSSNWDVYPVHLRFYYNENERNILGYLLARNVSNKAWTASNDYLVSSVFDSVVKARSLPHVFESVLQYLVYSYDMYRCVALNVTKRLQIPHIFQINFRYSYPVNKNKRNSILHSKVKTPTVLDLPSFTCINLFTFIFLFTANNVNERKMNHSIAWNFQSLLSRWNTVLNSGKSMFCKYLSRIVDEKNLYLWIKIFWNR